MPSLSTTLRLAFALLFALALALLLFSWRESRADRARLESALAAQQQLISASQSRERDTAAQLKSTLAQISALKRQVRSPQQILRSLPDDLPLPAPITLAPATEQGTDRPLSPSDFSSASSSRPSEISSPQSPGASSSLPSEISNLKSLLPRLHSAGNSPSAPAAEIPAADLKPLYDFVLDCRACQAQLSAARADLADEQARSAALARERNAAVTAAKGGSLWRRLQRNAKWLGIGIVLGAVGNAAASRRL